MKGPLGTVVYTALVALTLCGCNQLPGKARIEEEQPRPDQVKDFSKLYASNCAACHGVDGQKGPATALANPIYEAIVDDDSLRTAIRDGGPGKLMPAFGTTAGGMLTTAQVDLLVKGIRERWRHGDAGASGAPAYKSTLTGDPTRGEQAFQTNCVSCHAANGKKPEASILNASYLDLVSDQSLRNTIIAGRPDLGHPDWRSVRAGHPLTDQDVTDIVAWMGSKRDLVTQPTTPTKQ